MTAEGGMAFGYYKDGAHNPTFAYISKAMEAEKVCQNRNKGCSWYGWSLGRRGLESRVAAYHLLLPSRHVTKMWSL